MSEFSLPTVARLGYMASTLTCAVLAILVDQSSSGALDERAVLLLIPPALTLFHHLTVFVLVPSLLPFRSSSSATLSTLALTSLILLSLLFFTLGFVSVFLLFFSTKSTSEIAQAALTLVESALLLTVAISSFTEARKMTLSEMQKPDGSLEYIRGELEILLNDEERAALDSVDHLDPVLFTGPRAFGQPPVSWELLGCSPTQTPQQPF